MTRNTLVYNTIWTYKRQIVGIPDRSEKILMKMKIKFQIKEIFLEIKNKETVFNV